MCYFLCGLGVKRDRQDGVFSMKRTAALAVIASLATFGTAQANDAGLNWFMANDIIQNSPGKSGASREQFIYVIVGPAHLEGGLARISARDGYAGGNGGGAHFSFGGGKGGGGGVVTANTE
jgi:uncharacterized membrane protein YgcG